MHRLASVDITHTTTQDLPYDKSRQCKYIIYLKPAVTPMAGFLFVIGV